MFDLTRHGARVGFALVLGATSFGEAQVVRQITDTVYETVTHGFTALDDAGSVVYAASNANAFGTNPRHAPQVARWDLPGGSGSQVTAFPDGIVGPVSVSDDGEWLTFVSPADPLGLNHDESAELFVVKNDGSDLAQLTNDPSPNAGRVSRAVISGSANRVLFVSNSDLTRANDDRVEQLFVIDRDGANLQQLTAMPPGEFFGISISDAGDRVTFGHKSALATDGVMRVFLFQADGRNLRLIRSGLDLGRPSLSGNGAYLAFDERYDDSEIVFVYSWEGEIKTVFDGKSPSIRDDGFVLWFAKAGGFNDEIWSTTTDGGSATRWTNTDHPVQNGEPVVSGNGNRVVFRVTGGAHVGGDNPDGGPELMVMDANAANLRQLTTNHGESLYYLEPDITADGSRIVFLSRGLVPGGGSQYFDVHRVQADGSDLVRLTDLGSSNAYHPDVSADGQTIVFISNANVDGQNPLGDVHLYRVLADGTGLLRLTPNSMPFNDHPVISPDGSTIIFDSSFGGLYRVAPDGSGLILFFLPPSHRATFPRCSAAVEWVVYESDGASVPAQIWRVRGDGTGHEALTADPVYGAYRPDITADGSRVVYISTADPVGTNSDHNYEVFLYEPATSTRRQLTFSTTQRWPRARISEDGAWVYVVYAGTVFEQVPGEPYDVIRIATATGVIERVGGLNHRRSALGPLYSPGAPWYQNPSFAVSANGAHAVFSGPASPTDVNPDLSHELWFVDATTAARIEVGRESPTLISWDSEMRPVRYDVIRGNVASLTDGPASTVDLGAVVCLEDDSPDASTLGFEDSLQPDSGEAFFYLYRGSQGLTDGPGSFGEGSGGAVRLASSGGCTD